MPNGDGRGPRFLAHNQSSEMEPQPSGQIAGGGGRRRLGRGRCCHAAAVQRGAEGRNELDSEFIAGFRCAGRQRRRQRQRGC